MNMKGVTVVKELSRARTMEVYPIGVESKQDDGRSWSGEGVAWLPTSVEG